jgi:hypothetical protein
MPDRSENDLEARVSHLESEVVRLKDGVTISRFDAEAARTLAGGADRDVSDVKTLLRAHTHTLTLTALRETQIEHGERLAALEAKLDTRTDSLDARITTLDGKFEALRSEMQQGFGMLNTGMAQIVALLTNRQREDDQHE